MSEYCSIQFSLELFVSACVQGMNELGAIVGLLVLERCYDASLNLRTSSSPVEFLNFLAYVLTIDLLARCTASICSSCGCLSATDEEL